METKKTGVIKYDELVEMIERKFNIKVDTLIKIDADVDKYREQRSGKFDLSFEIK